VSPTRQRRQLEGLLRGILQPVEVFTAIPGGILLAAIELQTTDRLAGENFACAVDAGPTCARLTADDYRSEGRFFAMEITMTAVETTGTVDEERRLRLDEALPVPGPMRVRVIVLYPLPEGLDEDEWLRAASRNPAFQDLGEPEEDIYSLEDGVPFRDQT
jgi:hypothetical protein